MSISSSYFIDRTISRAARHLDLLDAAQNNKIPREAAKLRALAGLVRDNAVAYAKTFASQSVLSAQEFETAARERMKEMRDQQFAEVKRLRDQRRQHEEDRAELLAAGMLAA